MEFDNPLILECPHCGGLRRISCLLSGNDSGMTIWSDQKVDLPSMPSTSPVLRCPICKKYHFYNRSQIVGECRTHYDADFGYLSYESLKEALEQLKPQGKDEETLRMMLLWSYNDLYGQMHNVEILPDELQRERQFFRENALALFRLRPEDTLLHAELLRELGDFDKSITILKKICIEQPSIHAITIIQKAANKDANVCIIESDKFSETERFPIKDDKGYIYSPRKDLNWEYIKERFNDIIERMRIKFGWYDDSDDEFYLY